VLGGVFQEEKYQGKEHLSWQQCVAQFLNANPVQGRLLCQLSDGLKYYKSMSI
jgi:hypothetical protein